MYSYYVIKELFLVRGGDFVCIEVVWFNKNLLFCYFLELLIY